MPSHLQRPSVDSVPTESIVVEAVAWAKPPLGPVPWLRGNQLLPIAPRSRGQYRIDLDRSGVKQIVSVSEFAKELENELSAGQTESGVGATWRIMAGLVGVIYLVVVIVALVNQPGSK